ncbi:MAG: sulfurtransferase TusA family protein [Thermodesulfobacteriota bacterium]
MSNIVDAIGLSCPQPVLMTLDEIKKAKDAEMVVLVDNEASRENVGRAVESQGWHVEKVSVEGEVFRMEIRKSASQR